MLPSISQVEDLRVSRNLPLLGGRDSNSRPSSTASGAQNIPAGQLSSRGESPSTMALSRPVTAVSSPLQASHAVFSSVTAYGRSSTSPRPTYISSRRRSSATIAARRSGSGKSAHFSSDEGAAEKKRRHSQKEMGRRQRLKEHIDTLRDHVPGCLSPPGSRGHSREHVMERTVDFIIEVTKGAGESQRPASRRTDSQTSSLSKL